MAWTPPIDRRGKKDLLNSKRFYRLISQENNYCDPDMAFLFYMSLVSVVGSELRKHGVVRLPHIADIALVMQKPRPAFLGTTHAVIGSREVLKAYPVERLRRYFAKRQGPPRCIEFLRPPPAIR